ncbi:MAG TPA: cupredoxin domain-containing protein [Actinomycetota bacterium]|jgi:plastocyanin
MSDPVRTSEPVAPEDEHEEVPAGPRLPGFAYPLIAVVFAGVLVWSFSRILLAVDKNQAAAIALLMALNLLIGAALIAYGTRVRKRPAAFPFLLVAALALIAGGAVAAAAFGDRGAVEEAAGETPKRQAVTLEAKGIKFVQTELTLNEGADIKMTFKNEDAGTQHNFALFNGPNASAPVIFQGSASTGPTTVTYTFKAPPKPGSYYFHCDFHPGPMTGTVKVVAGGGGAAGAPKEEAKGIKFLQPKLSVTPTGGKVTIHFVNSDAGTQHNIAVFRGSDATAPLLFRGELITGPASADYSFDAPPPGSYFFHCDVHPTMTGTLTVSRG